jgi:hypothetical protein
MIELHYSMNDDIIIIKCELNENARNERRRSVALEKKKQLVAEGTKKKKQLVEKKEAVEIKMILLSNRQSKAAI